MASKVLNIQVGDRLTKVCLSVKKGKSYQISNSFMFQTPDNAVTDGVITAPDLLGAKLNEQLVKNGVDRTKAAVFSLISGKVATREVILPPVKNARIKGIVEANASDYFPIDMSRYHVTYKLLERTAKGENPGCRVLVFAVPVSLLESYFKMADLAGLNVQAIDFSGNSQYQALRSLKSKGVCMYVNVDCSSTLVTLIHEGKLLMQRTFTFGGDELILNYMKASGKSSDEYLTCLRDCSEPNPAFLKDGTMASSTITESLSRLVSSVVRSSDYFNSNHWEVQVEKVVLMGPCSRLVGLMEMVANGTGVETTWLDDVPGISSFANAAERVSFYITCIGSSIDPVDFMLPYLSQDRKKLKRQKERTDENSVRSGILILAMCIAAAAVLAAVSVLGYFDANSEKAAVEKQLAALAYTREIYNQYIQYQAGADSLLALDAQVDSPNDSLTEFIRELEQKMPSEILVLSATCGREEISMNVTVPSFDEVAVVLVKLRSFESVRDLNISAVTETMGDAGVSSVSFSVSCLYKTPELPAEILDNTETTENTENANTTEGE